MITAVAGDDADTAATLRKLAPLLVNGDYPKNSKGETYGPEILSELVCHAPDLLQAQGTKGETGYIRASDDPDLESPPPHAGDFFDSPV